MLILDIQKTEMFDNGTEKFYTAPPITLYLEHSLIAISKWEEQYKVPFLKSVEHLTQRKHQEKFLFYINCMSTRGEIPWSALMRLSAEHITQISKYMGESRTATVSGGSKGGGGKPVTSERLYALMACYQIPDKYSQWHISRLIAVIDICQEMNEGSDKKIKGSGDTKAFIEQNEAMRRAGFDL